MDKRHRLSISFKQEYRHVYEYLQGVPNKSDYIAKAVEEYISDEHSAITHQQIRAIVIEILQDQGGFLFHSNQHTAVGAEKITEEDADLINQLF
jgi:metal-responsive CopG/Arc/MetJ family transcriptional regulator